MKTKKPPQLHITISKNLQWIEKYLKKAKAKMPFLIMPKYIRSYRPSPKKDLKSFGSCSKTERLITLATHNVVRHKGKKRTTKKLVALSQKEILMTLAHELAHLRYFPHGYEQEGYAEIIFRAFGVLEKCPTCGGKGKVLAKYKNI